MMLPGATAVVLEGMVRFRDDAPPKPEAWLLSGNKGINYLPIMHYTTDEQRVLPSLPPILLNALATFSPGCKNESNSCFNSDGVFRTLDCSAISSCSRCMAFFWSLTNCWLGIRKEDLPYLHRISRFADGLFHGYFIHLCNPCIYFSLFFFENIIHILIEVARFPFVLEIERFESFSCIIKLRNIKLLNPKSTLRPIYT